MRNHNRRFIPATLLLWTLLLTACSSTPIDDDHIDSTPLQRSYYKPPAQVRDATMIWSSESGIDLLGEQGRLIRAAREAWLISIYGGIEETYPGFADAISVDDARRLPFRTNYSLVGTQRSHILTVDETDRGFRATICMQPSQYAMLSSDGKYSRWNYAADTSYIQFERTTAADLGIRPDSRDTETSTGAGTTTPSDPEENHWRAPTEDLFTEGGWKISFGAEDAETERRCIEWGQRIEPSVGTTPDFYITDTPPVTLPAYPGW